MSRLTEQIRMMEEMLQLQSKIRAKKEKERILKTGQREKYTNLFKPITNTLEKLKSAPTEKEEPTVAREEETAVAKDEPAEVKVEEDENLFDNVLRLIPTTLRDDGVFGLRINPNNPHVGQIGSYNYQVGNNNRIEFYTLDEKTTEAHITNPRLWALLLVKNPKTIGLDLQTSSGETEKFVLNYKEIVDGLGLVESAFANNHISVGSRIKYKIIKALDDVKIGRGFMFSVKPPPFTGKRVKPSTVVIPSDKKGLLRELYKAVAELRAGNSSMQNIVVPLAQEAKRRRILPRGLLSADEKTWVFA